MDLDEKLNNKFTERFIFKHSDSGERSETKRNKKEKLQRHAHSPTIFRSRCLLIAHWYKQHSTTKQKKQKKKAKEGVLYFALLIIILFSHSKILFLISQNSTHFSPFSDKLQHSSTPDGYWVRKTKSGYIVFASRDDNNYFTLGPVGFYARFARDFHQFFSKHFPEISSNIYLF